MLFLTVPVTPTIPPSLIDLNVNLRKRKTSFKYFSFLATHPKFLEVISTAWGEEIPVGSKLFSLGQRLSHVKKACRKLNKEGFENIQQKARDALETLQDIQSRLLTQPTDSLFAKNLWQGNNGDSLRRLKVFTSRESLGSDGYLLGTPTPPSIISQSLHIRLEMQ